MAINNHIGDYLDYYSSLNSPEYAVLIKGEWGAGKTWFIKKYMERNDGSDKKCLYVSLYGITNKSEIENLFFLSCPSYFETVVPLILRLGKPHLSSI